MPAKVNPLTLEKWTPADDETLQSVMAGKLPDVFRGSQPTPQPVPTPAAQWTAMAAHIAAILDQTQDKRRFILHYPQQAPFQVAVMFDIAEPVKKCPADVGDAGAPLLVARYRKHDPGWAPDEAKEAVVDFYKRQRDGFIREEAAVVQPGESIVGLEAPSKECVEECLRRFEANAALLDSSFADRFSDSPVKPTFIAARAVDLSKLGNGAYVELKDMKTDGYNGIRGLILARAENHPDRWAVAPIHKRHKKTVAALKHERPLAIKDSSLVVVDASEDEDSEDDVEDAD